MRPRRGVVWLDQRFWVDEVLIGQSPPESPRRLVTIGQSDACEIQTMRASVCRSSVIRAREATHERASVERGICVERGAFISRRWWCACVRACEDGDGADGASIWI